MKTKDIPGPVDPKSKGIRQKTTYIPELVDPKWIRLPKCGHRCPHSGLSRSALDQLIRPQSCNNFDPPVDSRLVKASGKQHGARLINYESLMKYLTELPVEETHLRSGEQQAADKVKTVKARKG